MKKLAFLASLILAMISIAPAHTAPKPLRTTVFGTGGYIWTSEKGVPVIKICPQRSRDLCAIIESCTGSGNPATGDLVTVEMQDGSGDILEGELLEVGANNEGATIDPATQCPR